MISRFLNPQGGAVPQGNDPFSLLQREVNRAFDEVFRGFPAMGRGAAGFGGFAPNSTCAKPRGAWKSPPSCPACPSRTWTCVWKATC